MKLNILVFFLFLTASLTANSSMTSGAGSAAQFFYIENVPNNNQTIVFTLHKACEDLSGLKPAPFSIQPFYSEEKYPVNLHDKSIKQHVVKIVHLYARYNHTCKQVAVDKFEQKIQIPRSNKMTHIYITVDPDVEVRTN
jgi:hypothetical protein